MDSNTKVVLVTGGSGGIGQATALEFARLGYKIAITGRDLERLEKTIDLLVVEAEVEASKSRGKSGDNIKRESHYLAIKADFSNLQEIDQVVCRTVEKFGHLDILINNAGYSGASPPLEDPKFFEDFQMTIQVNLIAPTRIAQLAAPHLKRSKGVLINVSSVADRVAFPWMGYCVSKAGLSMLTKTLAVALDSTGVRVLTVAPGPILTNFAPHQSLEAHASMTSLARIGRAEEVAQAIVFLCSDSASFIQATCLDVDGGWLTKFGDFYSTIGAKLAAQN